ncbi:MAG: hypothetical protein IJY70_04320 [Clostridia bacterium]|nr:hypothetical protein [Clostridia bacterium]
MDISTIASLLGKNGKTDDKFGDLLALLSGAKDTKPDALFTTLLGQMIKNNTTKPKRKTSVLGFVNDDILGKITRYMTRYSTAKKLRK